MKKQRWVKTMETTVKSETENIPVLQPVFLYFYRFMIQMNPEDQQAQRLWLNIPPSK